MKKNVAGQKIGAQMVSATDGSAFTGAVTVFVTLDAGAQATGSVGAGACTHEGNGYHTYAPAQAETNGDLAAFTFTGTGAVPATLQAYTSFPQTGDSFAEIGTAGAGLTAINLPNQTMDIVGNITGNLSGSVGSVTGLTTATVADAVWDEAMAGHLSAGSTGEALDNAGAAGTPPTVADIVEGVWDEATSAHTTAGTTGKALTDAGGAGTPPTVDQIVDGVWDESLAAHLAAGTTGAALNGAGLAGDPWTAALPGVYPAGSAGAIVGDLPGGVSLTSVTLSDISTSIWTDTAAIQAALAIDGLTFASGMETILACLSGVAVPAGTTVAFKKRDGTTTKLTITYGGADGERTASVLT